MTDGRTTAHAKSPYAELHAAGLRRCESMLTPSEEAAVGRVNSVRHDAVAGEASRRIVRGDVGGVGGLGGAGRFMVNEYRNNVAVLTNPVESMPSSLSALRLVALPADLFTTIGALPDLTVTPGPPPARVVFTR
jgi:hypothetical protein